MQWNSYRYKITENGITILQYLPEEGTDSATLLAGEEKSLLFDLEQSHDQKENQPSDPDAWNRIWREASGEEASLCIPDQIEGIPVTEIGEDAFAEYGAVLESIEVPGSVRRIDAGAFRMCMSLEKLILNEGVEWIGEDAFYLTPLEELVFPHSLRKIENAWELGNINWKTDAEHPWFYTDGYGLYGWEAQEKNEDDRDPQNKDDGGGWKLLVVSQKDERECYQVKDGTAVIGENAFSGQNSLKKLIIPGSVRTICDAAMESCQNLSDVVLGEGVRFIQDNAFSHCIGLKQLHLPASLEYLGEHAISDTFGWSDTLNGIESVTVASGSRWFEADDEALYEIIRDTGADTPAGGPGRKIVKYFGHNRNYKIPADVTEILSAAFRRSGIHELTVPASVQIVGKDAFRECKYLENIYLEESGCVLYIPANPVYRKDEITALFQQKERVMHRLNQDYVASIPEKWKDFSGNVAYYKQQLPENEEELNYVYDYAGYDVLFDTYLNLPDRIGIASCRMRYPVSLFDFFRKKYETFLEVNRREIMEDIAERDDMERLVQLSEIGYFTQDNIEECIDIINHRGRTKLLGFLMNYKQEHFGAIGFDFSL